MRLDVFLKKSQLIKRRVVAKELVEKQKILINEKVAKPSGEVKTGDILTLNLGSKTTKVKVTVEIRNSKEFPQFEVISAEKKD